MTDHAARRALRDGLLGWPDQELAQLVRLAQAEIKRRWKAQRSSLSWRALRLLMRLGCLPWEARYEPGVAAVNKAASLTEVEFRGARGAGDKTIAEIRGWLCENGMHFRGESLKDHMRCPRCAGADREPVRPAV